MNKQTQEERISRSRMNYKKDYGTVSLIALSVIFAVWLVIFFREVVISLKAYSPAMGISNSPWVGFANYKELFSSMAFGKVLRNTIIFNLLFSTMVFGIALIIGYILLTLPKSSIYRDTLVILCIFPLFLPAEVYTSWLITILGSSLFINPGAMRFLHPLFSSIKYVGIPIIILYILDETQEEEDPLLFLKAAGLFALTSLAFISNSVYSLTNAIYNPMVYESLDMIDTYTFRRGLLESDYSINIAFGVIQTFISLLSFAVLFVPIRLLFSATFKKIKIRIVPENLVQKLQSSIIALVIFTAIYFIPYILNGQSFDISKLLPLMFPPIIGYLLLSLFCALIAAVLAAVMSWSFINPNKKVVISAVIMLSLVTILAAKPINYSQYFMVGSMGFFNTSFAIILVTGFSAAAVWALACILKTEDRISFNTFYLAVVGILLIQAALIYNNSTPPTIYSHISGLSPILIFREMGMGMQNMGTLAERTSFRNAAGLYGFIISLPPLLLFLAAKIILPKRQLISIISGGMKL